MKPLTKIVGVVAILGALAGFSGYVSRNNITFAAGAGATLVGGVGYVFARSKEYDDNLKQR